MTLAKDIFWLNHIAREVDLPLWCFLVAEGIRKPVEYPDLDLEWFKQNNHYLGHLSAESEEYYALRKRLESLLIPLAEAAEAEDDFISVLNYCGAFDITISEIIWVKKRKLDEPERYREHEKSLKSENARRLTAIELSETEQELWSLVRSVTAELPHFDTATELAVKKMLEITTNPSTLQWLYESYLHTKIDWRFDVVRRIVELKQENI